jgi:hypothetical protein
MTTLVWFRLDETIAVAEHAMACPAQRITTAQVHAGARLRPALIWTTTDDEDALSSNGVPSWYDEDGQVHAARAWTWQHPATARRGTTDQTDVQRFLPLVRRHRDRRYPLITQLRNGGLRGGHWFVVDTDPQAAGSRDQFQVLDHRTEIAPPEATWVPATVTARAVASGQYPALVADGYTVRGDDVLARFDRPTVEQMIADLEAVHADTNPRTDAMPGEFAVLRFDGDVLQVWWEHDDGHTTRTVEIDRVHADAAGLFAAGAYLWPWHPTSTAPQPDSGLRLPPRANTGRSQ